jgi:hypothetical protein
VRRRSVGRLAGIESAGSEMPFAASIVTVTSVSALRVEGLRVKG